MNLIKYKEAVAEIDKIASNAIVSSDKVQGSFEKALDLAVNIGALRELLTDEVMKPIMALQNTDLGFRTDHDPKTAKKDENIQPYPVEIVRECVIEAVLRGYYPCGNEFNIISGRMYVAKNGLRRRVSQYPGLTNLRDCYGVPRMSGEKGAIVQCSATWTLNGVNDKIECEIPVRVNYNMGCDGLIGKCERKLLKRILDRITGVITPEGEVDDLDNLQQKSPSFPGFQKREIKDAEPSTTESKKQPADEFNFVKPAKTEKKPTPENNAMRKEVADYMAESRVSFDSFRRALADEKLVSDADSIGSWDEVPLEVCKALVENSKLTSKIVKNYATK